MSSGAVRFFNKDKGYGFIVPDSGGADVFVHIKDLRQSGLSEIKEGERVTFETAPGKDSRPKAVKVAIA